MHKKKLEELKKYKLSLEKRGVDMSIEGSNLDEAFYNLLNDFDQKQI